MRAAAASWASTWPSSTAKRRRARARAVVDLEVGLPELGRTDESGDGIGDGEGLEDHDAVRALPQQRAGNVERLPGAGTPVAAEVETVDEGVALSPARGAEEEIAPWSSWACTQGVAPSAPATQTARKGYEKAPVPG